MKKFLLLFLCAASFAANAQLTFSVRAGLSLSNEIIPRQDPNVTTFRPTSVKAGFYMGATVQIPLSANFSIAPGLVLAQKGYHEPAYRDTNTATPHTSVAYNLTYTFIDVPVLADLKVSKNINLQFGPQVSFLVKGTWKAKDPYTTGSFSQESTPKVILGLVAGARFHVWKQLSLSVHYNVDLQAHVEDPGAFYPLKDFRNETLQVGLTYQHRRRK